MLVVVVDDVDERGETTIVTRMRRPDAAEAQTFPVNLAG